MMSIRSIAFIAIVLATVSAEKFVLNTYTSSACEGTAALIATEDGGKCNKGIKFPKSPEATKAELEFYSKDDCSSDSPSKVTVPRVDSAKPAGCAAPSEDLYAGVAPPASGATGTPTIPKTKFMGLIGSAFSSAAAAGMVIAAVSTQF